MQKITISKPDDWHIHLRDKDFLKRTVLDAAQRCGRIMVMPNLNPPIAEVSQAYSYYQKIIAVMLSNVNLQPLMTLYLTDRTSPATIFDAKQSGFIYGCKLYPAGSTTGSDSGVTKIEAIYPALAMMEEVDLPLLVHGEVTHPQVDVFDRERRFIESVLCHLTEQFPKLRLILEHITTKDAIDFVQESSSSVAATITAHHLLLNRNDLFKGGINPHYFCLPILKHQKHQEELIKIATSGNPKFFFGSDSAPHIQQNKESACGCAGIYTGHASIELLAEVFNQKNSLNKLQAFCSENGANFYKLPVNKQTLTLVNEPWLVPESLPFGSSKVIPFRANAKIEWKIIPNE